MSGRVSNAEAITHTSDVTKMSLKVVKIVRRIDCPMKLSSPRSIHLRHSIQPQVK